jgi:hypothetical protein
LRLRKTEERSKKNGVFRSMLGRQPLDSSSPAMAAASSGPSAPPLEGISLAGFRKLFELHGGRAAFELLSTDDVKKNFVLPATEARRCAYVDLLRSGTPLYVAKANAFASHAYGYKFVDVIDALAAWEERHPKGRFVTGSFLVMPLRI